ncbi:MAG: hypothetical protein JNL21_06475 [Myxococcales bacterium]|nr:hypothetical protein [Myxococcales bacterium]
MARSIATPLALASAIALTAGAARAADDCMVEVDGIGLGFVIPDRGCKGTVVTDVQVAAATTDWSNYAVRGSAEAGGMWALPEHEPAHLGATLAVGGTSPYDGAESAGPSVDVAPLLRARYWTPPLGGGPSIVLDAAAGPAFLIPTGEAFRYGGYFELGASLHGALGLFFGVSPTVSMRDQTLQTRYSIGAKTTAVGVLIVLSIYACSQTNCT